MGYGGGGQPRKFYWKQVAEIRKLLDRKVSEANSSIDFEKYLLICEQLGEEPDPSRMPLETTAFPAEVQVAFFILDYLPDRYEGMSGTYLGKDWSSAQFFLDLYEVEDRKIDVYFMKTYEMLVVNARAEEAERKRKAEERKKTPASGGPKYTHNVRG